MAVFSLADGTYTVNIGNGGAGTLASSSGAGSAGGQTQIVDSNGSVMAYAGGGNGGNCNGGTGGAGGAGGVNVATIVQSQLTIPGAPGSDWITQSNVPGGSAFWGNITAPDGHAGLGGQGGLSANDPGKPGYVLITY